MSPDRPPRIVAAGFQHETNTFAPFRTGYAEFEDGGGWPPITFGDAVIEVFRDLNIPLGGFITASKGEAAIVPILWANAEPASHVSREAFDRIAGYILDGVAKAGAIDGIYLDLHGAMVTDDHQDGEGELLRRLRAQVGADMPIAVSLDLHVNLSEALVAHTDVLTIYRTYPHLDMDETGARAWLQLRDMIETGTRPAKAFRQLSRLIPLSAQCTDYGPLKDLYDGLDDPAPHRQLTADIALGFPLADIFDIGPAVVAYAADQVDADARADDLLTRLESAATVLENTMLSPRDAVARAGEITQSGGTVVLADVQDNSGAGAVSDSTDLLAALLESGLDRCVIGAVWDPVSAGRSHDAGIGQRVEVEIGGRHGPEGVSPVTCTATVEALSNGTFVCTGAMQRNVETDIGASALLRIEQGGGSVRVLVSSRRHQCIDQEVFRHLGVEPSEQRIVAVKSTVHFRADFAPIAREVIVVEAPGYSVCRLESLDFHNIRDGLTIA